MNIGQGIRKSLKGMLVAAGGVLGGVAALIFYGVMDFLYDPEFFRAGRKPAPTADTAPGEAEVEPAMLRAGSGYVEVTLRFRCGPGGISEDGGLKIGLCRLVDFGSRGRRPAFLYAHGWGLLQNRHPRLPNYYRCELRTSGRAHLEVASQGYFPLRGTLRFLGREFLRRCGVRLDPLDVGYLYLEQRKIRIRIRGARLEEGDEILVVLGDRSRGGRGWKVPAHPSRVDLAVEVDERASGLYRLIARGPVLEAVGGEATALEPRLTSQDGEGMGRLILRAVDSRGDVDPTFTGKVTLSPPPGLEIAREVVFSPRDRGVVSLPYRVSGPGVYRLQASCGTLSGESNPVVSGGEMRLLWGDLHVHTCLCDGNLEPREFYRAAREEEGLDFAAITMHDTMEVFEPSGREEEWRLIRELRDEFNRPGEFVVLLGYEWSDHRYGHRGVYFAPWERDPRVYGWTSPGSETPSGLRESLRGHHALVVPHHTSWRRVFLLPFNWAKVVRMRIPLAYTWWEEDAEQQRLVEIYSMHGASESYDGPYPVTHGRPTGWFPRALLDDRVPPGYGNYFQEALASGLRLGVVAGSDRHDYAVDERVHPVDVYPRGLTGVWAPELTDEEIWKALWNRRVYGTTGARMVLELYADGLPMGTEYYPLGPVRLEGRVLGTAPLRRVELVRGEKGVFRVAWSSTGGIEASFSLNDDARGERLYYLRVEQEDGHWAWSSPIWLLGDGDDAP
ncbi:MAG: CehA/McbA family metallohydrolase [Actinomycetota bacterium]